MILNEAFTFGPWEVRERELKLELLAQTESVFALSNGHIGMRGNLDEGEPYGLPGSYLNAFYELRPLPYPEGGYGFPESSQTVINVTNGKIMRLLVDDEPFDVRYGKLRSHERELDLRAGVLRRSVEWVSPAGACVRVRSTRLVSFAQRALAAIRYTVEPVDGDARIVLQSELVANEPLPSQDGDPRAGGETEPMIFEYGGTRGTLGLLQHRTQSSGLLVAAAMDHVLGGPAATESSSESLGDEARVTFAVDLKKGQQLDVTKFVAYGWSDHRSLAALRDQVRAALTEGKQTGWDGLLASQRSYLDEFWERADVEIEGDAQLQLAVRFSLFGCLQAAARAERRAIPAKGLTGPGYDGHTFWDMETFVLRLLTYTAPHAPRDALRWRHATLPLARERAKVLGFAGAAFPWRTIHGEECSGYWPASTAAVHINADIADAVERYRNASDDVEFDREVGVELLVETARLWRAVGHHDGAGRFRIDGVTGPDEYSAIADNNVYTNLMAAANLRAAVAAVQRHPDRATELGVDDEEAAGWRDAADAMTIPYDQDLDVHAQAEAFTSHQRFDFDAAYPHRYPLLLHFHYFDLYRKQVVKQADLVLAMHLCGDAFTDDQKERNFAYYEGLTVRDSSLSACTQAVLAAEVGQLELAYDYFGEAALIDIDDLELNTGDGLHIASLAGTWLAAVAGFGGMRDHGGELSFKPGLPPALTRLAFRLCFRGRRLLVEIEHGKASYSLTQGEPLQVHHEGKAIKLTTKEKVTRPIHPRVPAGPRPAQPRGREPARRRPGVAGTPDAGPAPSRPPSVPARGPDPAAST